MMENLLLTKQISSGGESVQGSVVFGIPALIKPPVPIANKAFGSNLLITDKNPIDTDNFVVISELNTGSTKSGTVYVYNPNEDGLITTPIQTLESPVTDTGIAGYGTQAVISNNGQVMVIGAMLNREIKLFVYTRDNLLWKYSKALTPGYFSVASPLSQQRYFINKDCTRFILVQGSLTGVNPQVQIYDLNGGVAPIKTYPLSSVGINSTNYGIVSDYCEETNTLAVYGVKTGGTGDTGRVIIFRLSETVAPVQLQVLESSIVSNYNKNFGYGGMSFSKDGKTLTVSSYAYKHLNVSTNKGSSLVDVYKLSDTGAFQIHQGLTPVDILGDGGTYVYGKAGISLSTDASVLITSFDGCHIAGIPNGGIVVAGLTNDKFAFNTENNQHFIQGPPDKISSGRQFGNKTIIDSFRNVAYVCAAGEAADGIGFSGTVYIYPFTREI